MLIDRSPGCSVHHMTSFQNPADQYGSCGPSADADQRATRNTIWTCREGMRATTAHHAPPPPPSGTCQAHATLAAILGELRAITGKMREDEQRSELTGEWKYAAMVIDRFCLWAFITFTALLTISVLLSAPHLIVL